MRSSTRASSEPSCWCQLALATRNRLADSIETFRSRLRALEPRLAGLDGTDRPMDRLAGQLALSVPQVEFLWTAVAFSADPRMLPHVEVLGGPTARRGLSVAVHAELVGLSPVDGVDLAMWLAAPNPLSTNGLLGVAEDAAAPSSRTYAVPVRLLQHLAGDDRIEQGLRALGRAGCCSTPATRRTLAHASATTSEAQWDGAKERVGMDGDLDNRPDLFVHQTKLHLNEMGFDDAQAEAKVARLRGAVHDKKDPMSNVLDTLKAADSMEFDLSGPANPEAFIASLERHSAFTVNDEGRQAVKDGRLLAHLTMDLISSDGTVYVDEFEYNVRFDDGTYGFVFHHKKPPRKDSLTFYASPD